MAETAKVWKAVVSKTCKTEMTKIIKFTFFRLFDVWSNLIIAIRTCGHSYKDSTIVNYDSRVVMFAILCKGRLYYQETKARIDSKGKLLCLWNTKNNWDNSCWSIPKFVTFLKRVPPTCSLTRARKSNQAFFDYLAYTRPPSTRELHDNKSPSHVTKGSFDEMPLVIILIKI